MAVERVGEASPFVRSQFALAFLDSSFPLTNYFQPEKFSQKAAAVRNADHPLVPSAALFSTRIILAESFLMNQS